tara:strand:+ start:2093 stop:2296 length:204 start_codon:yes stop_codon:yes gene_type:complete
VLQVLQYGEELPDGDKLLQTLFEDMVEAAMDFDGKGTSLTDAQLRVKYGEDAELAGQKEVRVCFTIY